MDPNFVHWLMVCHWFGDFVCQTREMAENKSKDLKVLFSHVLIYGLVLLFGGCIYLFFTVGELAALTWLAVNMVAHFAIDWITSKANAYCIEHNDNPTFWYIVGFDQLLHITTLLFTTQHLL